LRSASSGRCSRGPANDRTRITPPHIEYKSIDWVGLITLGGC
jgi:hypothetical protein